MGSEMDFFENTFNEAQEEGTVDPQKPEDGAAEDADELEVEPAVDPGQEEGSKKDPRQEQENIDVNHPRYKQIYGKLKELERTHEDLVADREHQAKLFEAMKQHNLQLAAAIQQGNEATVEAIKEAATPKPEDPTAGMAEKIRDLEGKRATARKEFNQDEADRISDEIMELKIALRTASKPEKQEKPAPAKPQGPSPEAVAAYKTLVEEVEWFENDIEMTKYAESVDEFLLRSTKWSNKPIIDRYHEVVRRTEEEFGLSAPEKPTTPPANARPRASAVERGTAVRPALKPKITLTDFEKELADGMGISYDAYLAQKVAIAQSKEI